MPHPCWLITGGAGFIGSHLVQKLLAETELRVVNLDRLTYAAQPQALNEFWDHPRHHFVRGDIGNQELVRNLLHQFHPQKILHLAAESHVDRSIDAPADFVATNVVGTYCLLEETLDYWKTLTPNQQAQFRFVHVSTDEVYGSLGARGTFQESTAFAPRSPYSASKAAADHFVQAYHHTYGLPTVITHGSNTYGPFQFPEKLIPVMITKALAAEPLPIYGDGLHVRDWMFVEDHCRALQLVAKQGSPGEVYNIAGNQECTNLELVEMLCEILEREVPHLHALKDLITFVPDRPGHDRRYAMDISKIQNQLGWQPQVPLEVGLQWTVQWYVKHLDCIQSGERTKRLGLNRFAA